jgi:hypothetical protein
MFLKDNRETVMANQRVNAAREQAADVVERAQEVAERGYELAKEALNSTSEKIDDLSRFGKRRPLLAMAVSFLAGFVVAKTFF